MNATPLAPASFQVSPQALRWRRAWLVLMLLGLALSYPAARLLPVSFGWENGWLEDLQVVVLLSGAVMAAVFARQVVGNDGPGRAVKGLALVLVPVWCLLAAREMSWGAVFLPPVGFSEDGPVYSSSVLWYKPAVYPLAAMVLAGCAWIFVRCRAYRVVLQLLRSPQFAWAELAVLVLAGVLSTYAEGHLGVALPHALLDQALVMEEWAEMFAYIALVAAQRQVFVLLQGTPRAPLAPVK
ncbi:hypothetical protein [Paracidovorax wautersii]|uniref:Uncharacterized protein n=1 Tax=Paracidovorax wautersii TaxID=1177982 RepID=A0ABU1IHM1_9BURK|nr:hypothetical protein [Paracidovorax wautersii]MDR6215754.1 hypothetical protein [Paracidovorax wautersii]